MPDITMCMNEFCGFKDTCYRYTANPNEFRQAYAEFKPKKGANGLLECDHYWKDTRTQREINNKESI